MAADFTYDINKDGTTKMRKQRNEKNEKTEVVQKKRKQRKAGKAQQVIDGGGVQVETCERLGRCQPSTLRKKIQVQ